jgi:hypothetical protein
VVKAALEWAASYAHSSGNLPRTIGRTIRTAASDPETIAAIIAKAEEGE